MTARFLNKQLSYNCEAFCRVFHVAQSQLYGGWHSNVQAFLPVKPNPTLPNQSTSRPRTDKRAVTQCTNVLFTIFLRSAILHSVFYIHNFYIHCILRSGPSTWGPILHSVFLPSVFYIQSFYIASLHPNLTAGKWKINDIDVFYSAGIRLICWPSTRPYEVGG